jgi:transposase-like protein
MSGESSTKQLVRLRTGRDDLEAHLRELYVERRYADREIAEVFGVDRTTVVKWRKEFGIGREARTLLS